MRKNFFCIALFISCVALPASAESSKDALNPLLTGAPSLSITPDARGGSMGDVGAATTPDINSQHWNPAKYPFIESNMGLAVSYTPWLSAIVNDIDLGYLSYYYKFDDLQAISTSFRYFSLGNIPLTTANEEYLGDAQPFELAVDVAYSRKLSEHFSAAVAFRFIYSDLNNGINTSAGGSSTEIQNILRPAHDQQLHSDQPAPRCFVRYPVRRLQPLVNQRRPKQIDGANLAIALCRRI